MKYSYLIAALSTPTQAQDEFLMEVIFLENLLFLRVVPTQAILFLEQCRKESDPKYNDSDIE